MLSSKRLNDKTTILVVVGWALLHGPRRRLLRRRRRRRCRRHVLNIAQILPCFRPRYRTSTQSF